MYEGFFKGWPKHWAYIYSSICLCIWIYRHIFSQTFNRSSYLDVPSWTIDICEESSWSLYYVFQSPVSWIVTGTCTHLKEREYFLLSSHDNLLSHFMQQYGKYLEGDIMCSKATNRKQEKIFFYILLASARVWTQNLLAQPNPTQKPWPWLLPWTLNPNPRLTLQ